MSRTRPSRRVSGSTRRLIEQLTHHKTMLENMLHNRFGFARKWREHPTANAQVYTSGGAR